MKISVARIVLAALVLSVAACAKNEPAETAAATPNAAKPAATAPADQRALTQSSNNGNLALEKPGAENPPVMEVSESSEAPEEPVAKNSMPPLKLAQLPPRSAPTSRFKEGVNYQRLSPTQPVSVPPDQIEVAEVFWYGCPHCNALDPYLEAWRKGAPPNGKAPYVAFVRIPAAWNDITRFHGRVFFAAESLGKLDELHSLIFREIHENGNPLDRPDKVRAFFTAHGVAAADFDKAFAALGIERKLDNAVLLAQRYRTSGVPHLVVNGKYITDVGLAGGPEQLIQLLNELAAREHAKE